MKSTDLFKRSKPVIRPFQFIKGNDPGDMPYLWDAYKKDMFNELPKDLDMQEFVDIVEFIVNPLQEIWMVEDKVKDNVLPVAFVVCKSNGWTLEPHVRYFDSATPRVKLRTWTAFMKKTKYRKDIGACLIRADKRTTNLANRVEKMGLIQFVGRVWGGSPSGDEYLYSIRCKRRH